MAPIIKPASPYGKEWHEWDAAEKTAKANKKRLESEMTKKPEEYAVVAETTVQVSEDSWRVIPLTMKYCSSEITIADIMAWAVAYNAHEGTIKIVKMKP